MCVCMSHLIIASLLFQMGGGKVDRAHPSHQLTAHVRALFSQDYVNFFKCPVLTWEHVYRQPS